MKILGCDPSLTNFGWCVYDTHHPENPPRGRIQTSSKELEIARYICIRDEVQRLIQTYEPDAISIEYPVFNNLYSEGMYGLFLYTWEAIYRERSDVVFFSPGQLKAHARLAIGRPDGWKMMKGDMVAAARTVTGGGRWNHNEADALAAAMAGARFWQLYDGEISLDDLTPVERAQFTKIHTFSRGRKAGKTERKGLIFREDSRFFRFGDKRNG